MTHTRDWFHGVRESLAGPVRVWTVREWALVGWTVACHYRRVRRASVADDSSDERRAGTARTTADERAALALDLGRRHLAIYADAHGIDRQEALLRLQRRRQARRRPSACIEALLR